MSKIKEVLPISKALHKVGMPLFYFPELNRIFGNLETAIFVGLLFKLYNYESNDEGWIYKTQKEIERETGLNRHQQEKARKTLKKYKVLEEQRRGTPAKLYYKINWDLLDKIISYYEPIENEDELESEQTPEGSENIKLNFESNTENSSEVTQTSLSDFSKQDCENLANLMLNFSKQDCENFANSSLYKKDINKKDIINNNNNNYNNNPSLQTFDLAIIEYIEKLWLRVIGRRFLTAFERSKLEEFYHRYGKENLTFAVERAKAMGQPHLSYIEGILKNLSSNKQKEKSNIEKFLNGEL
jgi:hypothetical protein